MSTSLHTAYQDTYLNIEEDEKTIEQQASADSFDNNENFISNRIFSD
jgi:hypothetical protein